MTLTTQQVEQLLQPIHPSRVLADGKGHAHVSQQDILAHLIRVFGFGHFDIEVLAVECVFEMPAVKNKERFDVCYRALVRLTIRDVNGDQLAHYENGSTATAQNQTRGDAHDLAYKSAISLSVKRAAIALGDQFGLSLYNKGQRTALVRGLVVTAEGKDVQDGVPQQVSMGNDEIDASLDGEHSTEPMRREAPKPLTTKAEPLTPKQLTTIQTLAGKLGLDRDAKLAGISVVLGRNVASTNDLTKAEAGQVIDSLTATLAQREAESVATDLLGAEEDA